MFGLHGTNWEKKNHPVVGCNAVDPHSDFSKVEPWRLWMGAGGSGDLQGESASLDDQDGVQGRVGSSGVQGGASVAFSPTPCSATGICACHTTSPERALGSEPTLGSEQNQAQI